MVKYATEGVVYAWRDPWPDAACHGQTRAMTLPDVKGRGGPRVHAHIAQGKAICAGCPVRVDCLAWALSDPDPAVGMLAGGLTPAERRRMRG